MNAPSSGKPAELSAPQQAAIRTTSSSGTSPENPFQITPPSVTLPKGGGAIRGIGEKFGANPVTGSGSMAVPIATSPGRSGFGPQLSLSYDSGAGNGPFGFGWNLSIPSISRKTDKGLPQYRDAEESDAFILSGAEDLVPEFEKDAAGNWVLQDGNHVTHDKPRTVDGVEYRVRRYRPRIEGLFARIERWTKQSDPTDIFWRSISKDNIITWYGKAEESRIADSTGLGQIFTWLICQSHDDKGNVILYNYKTEDSTGIDLSQAHERNRAGDTRATNRYLKRIRYGNLIPFFPNYAPDQPPTPLPADSDWLFEVMFDYDEGHVINETTNGDQQTFIEASSASTTAWSCRNDPFSTYRAGFEVRTYRLCQRVLMFHHFPGEPEVGADCLVRSTDFTYSYEESPTDARNSIYSFLLSVTQTGYRREGTGYLKKILPPVEFEYTQPVVQDAVHDVDAMSLGNLPMGVDGAAYQWTDLHGEGIPGILTEQAGAWFYKRNLSPIGKQPVEFGPLERVALKPNLALAGGAQFMDLAGDGQSDLVMLDGPMPGFYEHDGAEGWQPFRPFTSRLNRDMRDPNLKFVDLDGDGHADVLITEDDAFVWHPSLAEEGFGPARRVAQALDEEKGPRLVFADGTQSIYLADMSGDGLTDLARIRNGEVCYWPNLGYGRFGAKVTMDYAPHFDHADRFDHKRIRLADIDGSGTTDIVYLSADGVRLYFNQSGNSWSESQQLNVFPRLDDVVSIMPTDLLGNGTACLVWSSPLPGDARRQMRYVDLMGGQKPHLLAKTVNNLGAETVVQYAPSTKFYLQDKRDGKPWITCLPFPVHVVERVETFDHISRNRFVTRYKYHHGYFDGEEREFRGFGMVEQQDTEELAALTSDGTLAAATNVDTVSHVPPVLTKTWFHTGVYLGRDHVSDFFAGLLDAQDEGEYYREPGLTDAQVMALLLPDTMLPSGLTLEEEREACRALKGAMLRQEIYALDGTPKEELPYTVSEQNFSVRLEQPRGGNRHAVFFSHPREAITYHYERNPVDPRIQHALTLQVDPFGNVLTSAAIGYGRRMDAPDTVLLPQDREKQRLIHITCTENEFTNAMVNEADVYRTPLPAQSRTYELRKPQQEKSGNGLTKIYRFEDILGHVNQVGGGAHDIDYEDIEFAQAKQAVTNDASESNKYFRRLIERVRTLYRPNDLGAAQNDPLRLLPLRAVESLALPGESYKLALTPGLLDQVYVRGGQRLLPANPTNVLAGGGADLGGYVDLDNNGRWWIPSGRMLHSPDSADSAAQELAYARSHFFLPHRTRDPFHTNAVSTESFVTYDAYDLLMLDSRDQLGNRVTVGERLPNGNVDPTKPGNDYRVLQPWRVMDPNRNRTLVTFDILGMVVGTAVMGKLEEVKGDSLSGFLVDLPDSAIAAHLQSPLMDPQDLLRRATTRLVYDLFAYQRSKDQPAPQAAVVYTLARETHDSDPAPAGGLKIQHSFSYSDGFGREIQKKIQAEPEKIGGVVGPPRWVSSGWTIFNNKGKPVRQYEPFFSTTHRFEFGVQVGVSPILFYDPVERVVATLHPNHTYEKVVFDPWQQTTYDVNDTVAASGTETGDSRTDEHIKGYVREYFKTQPATWQTWRAQRQGGALGAQEQSAASEAASHADTPTTAHFDTLGRPFLTLADNGPDPAQPGQHLLFATRVELDIEGNQRAVRDAIEQAGDKQGRIVMRYAYDLLGNRIHQASMDAGARWMLNDVAGKPIRAWDSRGHSFRTEYDPLRRPLRSLVSGAEPANPNQELLSERLVYGEQHPEAELRNLRGKLYLQLDQAGVVANEAYDFKGNPLRASRRLTNGTQYKQTVDWRTVDANHVALPTDAKGLLDPVALEAALASRLEADPYTRRTTYDALNRPVTLTTPHTPTMQPSVIRPGYNEANLLDRVDANLRGATANGLPVWTFFVTNIDYDAKGQRKLIGYGNGATTTYNYDPLTFRLTHLTSTRPPGLNGLALQLFANTMVVQDLGYTYDPAGNITRIEDTALGTMSYNGENVEPVCDYNYDAIYRLIEANGREHIGQTAQDINPPNGNRRDYPFIGLRVHPNNMQAMRNYTEHYEYDAVGNFEKLIHHATNGNWTRSYAYDEDSLIEPAKKSNRLRSTTVGNNNPPVERYVYDAHGNMIRMPHLGGAHPSPNMHWDYRDQLRQTDLGGGGTTYYVYDATGQRVRKVWEKSAGLIDERIYLGGFEIFRQRRGTERLERETLHLMDDKQRIALVETRTLDTAGNDPAPQLLIRYQFSNHLGSASLELDDQSQIISYEEYIPYGNTSYQAVRSQTETPKRCRYTGKERDEESGLYYHGARYYAPWLGRWISCDPKGIEGGINLYTFTLANPIILTDPTGQQGENAIDDLLTFLHAQAGFETGAVRPPTFSSGSASPFGTAAHSRATEVLKEMKALGMSGAERIYSEVRVVAGRIEQIGGKPGGPAGSHNIDILVAKEGQVISKGQSISGGVAERIGDLKYGGGTINPKYGAHGSPLQTITGRTQAGVSAVNEASTVAKVEQGAAAATQIAKVEQGANLVSQAAKAEQTVATVAKGAEAGSLLTKAAPIISAIAKPLAVIGKVAGPLGLVAAGAQLATAKTTEQKVDAGITAASSALMMSKHPVAIAAGAGLMAGQLIDKTLNVSDYSSEAGVKVYEKLKEAGLNDTASFVIGGVASVAAIPSAIGYGAAAKVASWFR
ncbi:MAG: SpvB/TcaC N-terminal domain-containing protein [Nitrospira sp.]